MSDLTTSPTDDDQLHDGGEWVSHKDAVKQLVAAGRSISGQRPVELEALAAAGALMTSARNLIMDNRHHSFTALPPVAWEGVREDPMNWAMDWNTGTLTGKWSRLRKRHAVEAYGVEFHKEQLASLLGKEAVAFVTDPAASHSPASPSDFQQGRTGGSPGKVESWHLFWLTAMGMLNRGEIQGVESQAELRRRLLSAINDGLSEESIKPQVRRIWHQILEKS